MRIQRVGERQIVIPGYGLTIQHPRGAAAPLQWWQLGGATAIIAYQPKGAASYEASKTNLAQPGVQDAVKAGANDPTWTAATGWQITGSANYMRSNAPITVDADKSQTLIIQFTNADISANFKGIAGRASTVPRLQLYARYVTNIAYANNVSIIYSGSSPTAAGNLAVTGAWGYKNGSPDVAIVAGGTSATDDVLYIGLSGVHFCAHYTVAVAYYDVSLNDAQIALVAAAMAAL